MEFITDRTEADALLGTLKGTYLASDLNRVESAVEAIQAEFPDLGISVHLPTKTDWKPPEDFAAFRWVVQSEMKRYLNNVKSILFLFPMSISLPESMDNLDWMGANNIERVLQTATSRISAIKQSYFYSGEIYAGEE